MLNILRRKNKGITLKLWPLIVLNKEHFYGKSCRKCVPKASHWPFFYFGKQPKTAIAYKNFFQKLDILKEDYQKPLKNLTLFFLSNPVPFNRQSYQKQKGSGTSHQLLFRLQNKFRKIPLLVIYYLTKFDDII